MIGLESIVNYRYSDVSFVVVVVVVVGGGGVVGVVVGVAYSP